MYDGYPCSAFYIINGIPYFTYSAVEGSVTVTQYSTNHITGNFNFKADGPGPQFPDRINLTQGVFDMYY